MSQEIEESTSDLASKAFASHAALFPLPEFAALSSSLQSDNKHAVETELPNQLISSQNEQREEFKCAKEFKISEFTTHKELLTIDEYDKNDDAASAICALLIAYRWYTCAELAHEMALPTLILEEAIRNNDSSFLLQQRLLWWLRCHVNIAHKIPSLLRRSLQTSVHKSSNYGQVYKERNILSKSVTPELLTATAEHVTNCNEHNFEVDNTDEKFIANNKTLATNLKLVKMQDVNVDESFYNALNVTSREHYTILESTVGQNFISILNNTTNNVPALRSVPLPQNSTSGVWGSWISNKLSSVLDVVNGAAVIGGNNNNSNNYNNYYNSKTERGITNWTSSYNTPLIDVLRIVQNSQSTESSSTLIQQYQLPVDFTNYIHLVAGAYYVNRKENEEKYIHKKREQQQQQQQIQSEYFAEYHLAEEEERQNNESVHEHITSMIIATEVIDNNFILPWPEDVPKEYYKATFDVRDEINNLFSNSSNDVENGKTSEKQLPSNEHLSSQQLSHNKNEKDNYDISEKNNQMKHSIIDNTNNLSQEQTTQARQLRAAKINSIKPHASLAEEKQAADSSHVLDFTNSENVRRINTSSTKTEKITSDSKQGGVCLHGPFMVTNVREVHHSTEAHQSNPIFISINNFASDNDLLETRDSVLRAWCDRVQECLFIHVQHKSNDFFTISNTYRHLGEDASAALHQVHFARVTQLAERTRFVNDILVTAALYRRRNNLLNVYHVLTSAKRVSNQLNKLENWIRLPERELEELPQYVIQLLSLEQYVMRKSESFNVNDANDADKQRSSVSGQKEENNLEQIEQEQLIQDATISNQHNLIMHKDTINKTFEEYDWSTLSHLKWVSKFPERLTSARHALEQLIRDELIKLLLTLSTETANNALKHSSNKGKINNEENSDDEHDNNKMFVSTHVEANAKTEAALTGSTSVQYSHDNAEENSTQINSYEHAASLSCEALRLNILSDALEGFTINAMHLLWTCVKENVTSNLISSEELNDVQANDLLTASTTSSQPTIDEKRTLLRFCNSLRFAVFMQLFQQINEVLLQEVELIVQRWGYYVLQSLSPALYERKSEHDALIRSASVHLFHVICTEAESIIALMMEARSETLQSRREMELLLRRGYRVTRELLQPIHQLQLILPNVINKIECELRVGKAMQLTGCKVVKTFVKQYHAAHLSELNVILESEVWSAVEVILAKYQRQISKLCELGNNTLTYRHYDHDYKSNSFHEDNNINRDSSSTSVGESSGVTNSKKLTITNAIMHFRRRSFDNYFVLPSCESLSNINEDYTHSYSEQSRGKSNYSNSNTTNSTTYDNIIGIINEDDDEDDDNDDNEDDSRNQNSIKWNNNNNSAYMESKNTSHARCKSEIVMSTATNISKNMHRERELEDVVAKSNKLYISLLDDSGDGRVIAHSVFYVIKLLVEYERHLAHFPSLAYDLILKQSEILEKYDQLAASLILGANAIEKGTLKTITATHLCVASQCMALLAELTERMQQRLTILLCASRSETDQTVLESSSSHVCNTEKRVNTIHQEDMTTLTAEPKKCVEYKVIKHVSSTTADNNVTKTSRNSNYQSNTIINDNGVSSDEHNDKVKCKDSDNCSNQNSCSSAEVNKLRTFIEQSFSRVVHNLYTHRNDCFHKIAVLVETKVDSLGNIDSGQEWKIRGNEWVMTMLREVARLMRTLRPLLPQGDINGVLVPLLCSLTMKIRESTRSIAPTDTDAVNASRSDVLLFKANVERFGYDVLSCAAVPSVKAAMSTNNYAPHSSEDEVLKWFFPSLVSKSTTQTANTLGTERKTIQTTANTLPTSQNKV